MKKSFKLCNKNERKKYHAHKSKDIGVMIKVEEKWEIENKVKVEFN